MPGLERDADLAVGLEAANTGAVTRARVHNDKRPACQIEFDAAGRYDPYQCVIHRPLEFTPVDHEFDIVIEHMWRNFLEVLAILIPTLAHYVPEEDASLCGIDHILDGGGNWGE